MRPDNNRFIFLLIKLCKIFDHQYSLFSQILDYFFIMNDRAIGIYMLFPGFFIRCINGTLYPKTESGRLC